MRKTKIICTIGPASETEEVLTQLALAGMNVARLNFSHGTHEEHKAKMDLIKKVREKLNLPIAIMLDTKGPEYRIGTFENKSITLSEGDKFTFTTDDVVGNQERVSVSYKKLVDEVKVGETILVCNGLMIFNIDKIEGHNIICTVKSNGKLSDHKSMNFPNHVLRGDFLSEQDKSDLLFGIQNDIDFIAASFVSNAQNIKDMRTFVDANGGKDIDIIAKIENQSGVDNIDDIISASDGIMVARGDLGVEVPFQNVPAVQKHLISRCRSLGKRVITATEMLESMITNPRPTRAEVSDIANAVYDGATAVMLSGETAAGQYPVEAVKAMAEVALRTEEDIHYANRFHNSTYEIKSKLDAISNAACQLAINTNAKCIIVNSISGKTVRKVSRFRCPADIIGLCTDHKMCRKLNLNWGVTPVHTEQYESADVMIHFSLLEAKRVMNLQKGDNVVLTLSNKQGISGSTNTIHVETIA